jgi:hypothetical protein
MELGIPPNKLKTEMYLVSESHEQVKFTYIHLVSINPEKLHPEMYIRCLEKTTSLPKVTDTLYHILMYRVPLAMSGIQTQNIGI